MSLTNWILMYVADIAFWAWIFLLGGADVIGDTFFSGIFSFLVTLKWREISPEGVKLFGILIVIVHTIFFGIGLMIPVFRTFFRLF